MALEIVSKLARVLYECGRFIDSPEQNVNVRFDLPVSTVHQMCTSPCLGKSSTTELLPCDLAPQLSPGMFSHPENKALRTFLIHVHV